jgi:hypothetical protein
MYTDKQGYTRFKTREVDAKGTVLYQHKEAINCAKAQHYFRKIYSSTDKVNNRDDSDVDSDPSWKDWREKAWQVYNIDQLFAIKTFVCSKSAKLR